MGVTYGMELPAQETPADQVHDLLGHLYDFAYLQQHPLTRQMSRSTGCDTRQAMRRLRTILLETIEELSPGFGAPADVAQARLYSVLRMHYVDAMQIKEVAEELGISRRQVFRNLRTAEGSLLDILWPKILPIDHPDDATEPADAPAQAMQHETQRLSGHSEPVCLAELLSAASKATCQLASRRHVNVDIAPARDTIINTHPTMARQLLVSLLSYVIQQARGDGTVRLDMHKAQSTLSFTARFEPDDSLAVPTGLPKIADHLLRQLGGRGWLTQEGQNLVLRFALRDEPQTTLLVIDDNESMADLVRRYVAGTGYRVITAESGAHGLDLVKEMEPSAILLDVMMPDQDGWEVLQLLKADLATEGIPIIVCSVFDDPKLAQSLGASGFLSKPVSRAALLEQLDECRRRESPS